MGDPAGIGPEVLLKALARSSIRRLCVPVVFGDLSWLLRVQNRVLKRHPAGRLRLARTGAGNGAIRVVDFGNVRASAIKIGRASGEAGRASGEYIATATEAVMHRFADALVTAPINKVSFNLGGWGKKYVGHTEMLAALTGTKVFGLMLVHGALRAVHVTSHCPLRDVARLVTRRRVSETIQLAAAGLRSLGIPRPRIAVCGLNPHAGDGGVIGREEIQSIAPAITDCRRAGIRAEGPYSADSVWPRVLAGEFDVGVAMYHDQGQIPIKLSGFHPGAKMKVKGVNVTLGLPIIRTSVAHGTAYELAGRGIASEESFVDAIVLACEMSRRRGRSFS